MLTEKMTSYEVIDIIFAHVRSRLTTNIDAERPLH